MRKMIDGKIYDTEKAEKLASWDNGEFPGDFRYFYEAIYRTKSGALFLYGSGGAMSKYAVSCGGNSMGGSHDMRVISEERAKELISEYLEDEEMDEALQAAGISVSEA